MTYNVYSWFFDSCTITRAITRLKTYMGQVILIESGDEESVRSSRTGLDHLNHLYQSPRTVYTTEIDRGQ